MRTIDACNEQTLGNNQSIAILAFTSTQESRPFVVQSTQSWTILHFSTPLHCHILLSSAVPHLSQITLGSTSVRDNGKLTSRPTILGKLYGNARTTWTAEWQLLWIASGTLVRPQGGRQQS